MAASNKIPIQTKFQSNKLQQQTKLADKRKSKQMQQSWHAKLDPEWTLNSFKAPD
jgi:hypothetical protein